MDEAIILLLKQGNESALKTFMAESEEYFSRLARGSYGFLMKVIPIEDLLEDAFFICLKAIEEYDEKKNASFKTFVTLCVTRSWLKLYKQLTKDHVVCVSLDQKVLKEDIEYTYHDITPDNDSESFYQQIGLVDEIDDIIYCKDDYKNALTKEVVKLKLRGYTLNEISISLDIPLKKVNNILYKARKMIKSRKE